MLLGLRWWALDWRRQSLASSHGWESWAQLTRLTDDELVVACCYCWGCSVWWTSPGPLPPGFSSRRPPQPPRSRCRWWGLAGETEARAGWRGHLLTESCLEAAPCARCLCVSWGDIRGRNTFHTADTDTASRLCESSGVLHNPFLQRTPFHTPRIWI